MYKAWEICGENPAAEKKLIERGLTPLAARVLAGRGVENLDPALETKNLSDPFLMADMGKAAERIFEAVGKGEKIWVWGDYDCDGVCATVILYEKLIEMGADARWYIPTRDEGYGLRAEKIEELRANGCDLLITVDNGISAIEEAQKAKALGMDLIITDHHRPGEVLPEALAVIDPFRRDCFSPYKTVCGAVVALRLAAALDAADYSGALDDFGDLAALATIGDVMPLTGENRYLVKQGLKKLSQTERTGLAALIEACGLRAGKEITARDAAFGIVPRINATGRFATASLAVNLLMENDPEKARKAAEAVCALNRVRKSEEEKVLREIHEEIRQNPKKLCERVLFFAGENWHAGVIGIAAARLEERFGKPCFLLTKKGEEYRGSARGFGAFSVFGCLRACGELLIRYGGHPGAGGFSVLKENVQTFEAAVQRYAARNHPQMPQLTLRAACKAEPAELTAENLNGLKILEPCGEGNETPLFVLEQVTVTGVYGFGEDRHTKITAVKDGQRLNVKMFGTRPRGCGICAGMTGDFLVSAQVEEFRGELGVTIRAEDFRISERERTRDIAAMNAYDSFRRGEALPSLVYYRRMCPTRKQLEAFYRLTGAERQPLVAIGAKLREGGLNACSARICADIFAETGLLEYDAADDTVRRLPVREKKNLLDSATYREILALAKIPCPNPSRAAQ